MKTDFYLQLKPTKEALDETMRRAYKHVRGLSQAYPVVVSVAEDKNSRSAKANRYYWAVIIESFRRSEIGAGMSPNDAHHTLLCGYFGYDQIIDNNGHSYFRYKRSTTVGYDGRADVLKVVDFIDYCEWCIQVCANNGVQVLPPDPEFWRKKTEEVKHTYMGQSDYIGGRV